MNSLHLKESRHSSRLIGTTHRTCEHHAVKADVNKRMYTYIHTLAMWRDASSHLAYLFLNHLIYHFFTSHLANTGRIRMWEKGNRGVPYASLIWTFY